MLNVIVIGGGPAGMMAAGTAAARGHLVTLLDKNEKTGKKLYLTGKGRCNVTNNCNVETLISQVNANARFLYSAFNAFGSADTIRFFEERGVRLKTERGRRVFPASDHASDISTALEHYMRENGVRILLKQAALAVGSEAGRIRGVRVPSGFLEADAVIVATGGLSYPSTGATGDGYRFAQALGHQVTPTYPSLVPLVLAEEWVAAALEGLSLKNVRIVADLPTHRKKPLFAATGEMLFTRNGLSGPLILSASRYITDKLDQHPRITVDLKPALAPSVLDERIRRDFLKHQNKDFANALEDLLPRRLIGPVTALCGIPPERKTNAVTREERLRLGAILKGLSFTPVSTAGYQEAVVTMGGVDVHELNPSTLMSKNIKGLYFAGEVLDVDAMTGGYNLQIAFSTGYLAGKSVGLT